MACVPQWSANSTVLLGALVGLVDRRQLHLRDPFGQRLELHLQVLDPLLQEGLLAACGLSCPVLDTRPRDPLTLPSDRDHTGRDLGTEELELLRQAVESGHLNSTGGTLTPRFEAEFAARHGLAHAVACSSGSAAVHAALGALGLQRGDEVVTTPITDMGAVLPIAYEGAIPVFADVDAGTGNVTAESVERCLTQRTRAVIVTHLFGQPADTAAIVALCRPRGIVVIEDAAQAFLAEHAGGALAGTVGDLATFSFQQGKHLTTGEGGMVVTDDSGLADAVARFVNKGWGYGDAQPDHDRPGLNYRMTELQSAVGIAQLAKLDGCVDRRRASAATLCERLADLEGARGAAQFTLPRPQPGTSHSYWRFALLLDEPAGTSDALLPDRLGARLRDLGVGNAPRYVKKPAFDCAVFRDPGRFGPLAGAFASAPAEPLGSRETHPGCYRLLSRVLVLPWNEQYSAAQVDGIAAAVRDAWLAETGVRDGGRT